MTSEKRPRRPQSKGKCVFCGAIYAKSGMSKHLETCKKRHEVIKQTNTISRSKPKKWLHLSVTGVDAHDYWLHIEIDAEKKLADLDQFLRDIWLECCGHLSAFNISGRSYSVHPMGGYGERSMVIALNKVVKPGMEFRHEYDFGTTTELVLKVLDEREGTASDKKHWLTILARNDPPELVCEICRQKPATQVCSMCIGYQEGAWVCDDCVTKHSCYIEEQDDYMFLPVVNSPRIGMCGYTGSELYP